jgi:hypothetical protein
MPPYLTMLASFSSICMASMNAVARSRGVAFLSHTLFELRGGLVQSGSTPPLTPATQAAAMPKVARVFMADEESRCVGWTTSTSLIGQMEAADPRCQQHDHLKGTRQSGVPGHPPLEPPLPRSTDGPCLGYTAAGTHRRANRDHIVHNPTRACELAGAPKLGYWSASQVAVVPGVTSSEDCGIRAATGFPGRQYAMAI